MSKAVEERSNEHRLCHQDWIVDYGQVNAMLDRSYRALIVDDIIRVNPNSDPPCLILLIFKYSDPWCLCFESSLAHCSSAAKERPPHTDNTLSWRCVKQVDKHTPVAQRQLGLRTLPY